MKLTVTQSCYGSHEWFKLPPDWREQAENVEREFLIDQILGPCRARDAVAEFIDECERKYYKSMAWRRAKIREILEQLYQERQQKASREKMSPHA